MTPLAVFASLAAAKAGMLAGKPIPISAWTVPAYLWQDALVALLVGCLPSRARGPVGLLVVVYAAANVAVARVLSTPLTWALLHAAGGALSDSILRYATVANLLWSLPPLAVLVWLGRRREDPRAVTALLLVTALVGFFSTAKVDTLGLHRNAAVALVASALPRMPSARAAGRSAADWRASPLPDGDSPGEDLSRLRGMAAGRNVLVVVLESTAARYLGAYGATPDPMPRLTSLAREAIVFDAAYSVYPESIKGLFAVLCSTFPALDTEAERYARLRTPSIADVLSRAGYRTGMFHSGRFAYLGMDAVVEGRGFHALEDAGDIGGEKRSSFGLSDERIAVKRVLSWIDERPKGEKFFAMYLPVAGHHPYLSPDDGPFPEKDEIDRYRNSLHHADVALGALLDGLRTRGLDRSTLVLVYGDHGEAFGQHPGNFAHTLFVYDENVRVPFLVAAPGALGEAIRVKRPASLVDTAPTLLDLLGIEAPRAFEGRSLLDGVARVSLFFTDYSLGLLGLRDGRWKYIHELESGRSRLYDVKRDPEETRDVAPANPERVEAYRRRARAWIGSAVRP